MNKRYIDFVPSQKKTASKRGNVEVNRGAEGLKKVAERQAARRAITRAEVAKRPQTEEVPVEEIFAERPRRAGVSTGLKAAGGSKSGRGANLKSGRGASLESGRGAGLESGRGAGNREPKYGVIEDYRPKFVMAKVEKRPLGAKKTAGGASKATKEDARGSAGSAKVAPKKGLEPTRAKFVNTNKIEKRPLSKPMSVKNVYAKKPVAPKEEPKRPVTIIDKPEKDSKAGMIIAVILTIILGAAAGTVAFLLLPR